MKRIFSMMVTGMAAMVSMAQITPVHEWTCNTDDMPPVAHDLEVRRGENMIFRTKYRNLKQPMNISDARNVVFLYTKDDPATNTAYFGKTGSVTSAAGGITEVPWGPEDCPAQDYYFYEQLVIGPTSTLGRAFGRLSILPAVGDAPFQDGTPRQLSLLDWSSVVHLHPEFFPFTNLTASVTNAVAKINSRSVTTNYLVSATNSSWDGSVALLTPRGSLTLVAGQPIARIEYEASTGIGIDLVDEVQTGSTWFAQDHGTFFRSDVSSFRIRAVTQIVPPGMEADEHVTVSNLQVWTWEDAALVGTTNEMAGIHLYVDDPSDPLDAVNLRTLESRGSGATTPSTWAQYDALGNANSGGGINAAGQPVWLDNRYSLLADGGLYALSYDAAFNADGSGRFALQHNGQDLLTAVASNTPLAVVSFSVDPQVITIGVATNGVLTAPRIEVSTNLMNGRWSAVQSLSSWPVATNGQYELLVVKAWNSTVFFRAMQQGTNETKLVAAVPLVAGDGITLGGEHRTTWPVGGGGGGTGSYTNTEIAGVANTNGVRIGNGSNTTWRNDDGIWILDVPPSGPGSVGPVWDADSMGTNLLSLKIGGQIVAGFDSNGLALYHGTVTLWESDLRANMMVYDGSRRSPSITLQGHPGEIGFYGRGYMGSYGFGLASASNDVLVMWRGGITLLTNSAAFTGNHAGDAGALTNVPEPWAKATYSNALVSPLPLPSLTVTGGAINVRSGTATVFSVSSTGVTVIRGQDSDARYIMVNTNWPDFTLTNVFAGVTSKYVFVDGICTNKL